MQPKVDFLHWAHPLVQEWFRKKFGEPTEPQQMGWPAILAGKTTLISAPTGSGKTFAAFLACLDGLIKKSLQNSLLNQTEILYISPLKALGNDILKNLMIPLQEMTQLAKEKNLHLNEIRVAVRTGDTLPKERQAMLKKPPHILVTTPESFYILLTAEKSREQLRHVHTVIVDEIHALANDKRGAHLTLSLERLNALTSKPPVRIGLSATQKPLNTVAQFLTGNNRANPEIINIGYARQLDIQIEVTGMPLSAVASNEMWDEIYDRIAELSTQHRTLLVFVNTRRLAERVAHHLGERLGEDQVAAHHGSLSRKIRLAAETKLKNGELKALVATASLELGIDIGSVDLVCQIGSPRSIAVTLQRVGRAGHWHGAISKGKLFVTTRDELIECAAIIHAIQQRDLDKLIIPDEPLDVLAQQIVAACATQDWREEDLFQLIKNAYPYNHLSKQNYLRIIEMLAEGVSGKRGRYGAYLHYDRVNNLLKARRGARLAAITSGGAIPDNGLFTMLAEPDLVMVGTLDEDFAIESNKGDIILLGTTSWIIKRVESAAGRVLVENAQGAPPSVPFWRGEAPARTKELSWYVSQLREKIQLLLQQDNLLPQDKLQLQDQLQLQKESENQKVLLQHNENQKDNENKKVGTIKWLKEHCGMNQSAAEQVIEYIIKGVAILGTVPSQHTIIAERFFDEGGGMQLVIHAPFGARINKAWGLALRKRFCRSFNFELQAAATDNGLTISLAEQHSFPLADVFHFLHPNTLKEVLTQAVLQSPLFNTRWRWTATRALALLRFRNGKKIPPHISRILSEDLLAAVFPDAAACQDNIEGDIKIPDHPIINEAMKDILNQALDLEGLTKLVDSILNNNIRCIAIDTPVPSVFSHEILNANPYAFLDDAQLEERRARAVELRRVLPETVLKEIGKLDPAAIKEVQAQAWPDIRTADELQDFLQTIIAFPANCFQGKEVGSQFINQLLSDNRVFIAKNITKQFDENKQVFWVAMEKAKLFFSIYPDAVTEQNILWIPSNELSTKTSSDTSQAEIVSESSNRDIAIETMIRGWMFHLGPVTSTYLSQLFSLSLNEIDQVLLKLESTGLILRGQFTQLDSLEWCERRLLSRIHRNTVNQLRKEIQPVSSAQFIKWLLDWQHISPGHQLTGEHGLLEIIRQLQGFEAPANAWESQIFTKRIKWYDASMLDHLCLTGVVGWGRLSAHPLMDLKNSNAFAESIDLQTETKSLRRVFPTSVAPITFFIRDEADWLPTDNPSIEPADLHVLSHHAKKIYDYLKIKGASFFADIVRGVQSLKSEVERGLWELVTLGLITADGFDNLRSLIDPHRRLNKGRRRKARHGAGRWSLLHTAEPLAPQKQLEAICWNLLKRYGIVFRDLLAREKILPSWRDLLITFRRLEDRGEIRGGRFVSGFLGEQFALPYAVESLRSSSRKKLENNLQMNVEEKLKVIQLSAADPLNLVGIILPGEKISSTSLQQVTLDF